MARSPKSENSVYDFLYVDADRIGILLSQFGTDGLITQLTRAATTSSQTDGGFDVKIAKLNAQEGEETALTRSFDPRWLVPLMFLEKVADMMSRDLSTSRIGQFVLATGSLSIMDLALFKGIWSLPAIREAAQQSHDEEQSAPTGNRHQRRAARGTGQAAKQSDTSTVDSVLGVIGMLPHAVQSNLVLSGGKGAVWSSLKQESLITSSSDILLKHGTAVAGNWSIVGVLDAFPDIGDDGELTTEGLEAVAATVASAAGPFGQLFMNIIPHMRTMLGRPLTSYGITPLLIFREITA